LHDRHLLTVTFALLHSSNGNSHKVSMIARLFSRMLLMLAGMLKQNQRPLSHKSLISLIISLA